MADIEGFTDAQNTSLAGVQVGNLVLVSQELPHPAGDDGSDDHQSSDGEDGEDDSDDDNDNDGSNEDNDDDDEDDEDSDSEDHSSGSESSGDSEEAAAFSVHDYRTLKAVEGDDATFESTRSLPITVYLVTKITKYETGYIQDLTMVPLPYSTQQDASAGVFHLFGNQCVPSIDLTNVDQIQQEVKVSDLPGGVTLRFTISPDGGLVRRIVFGNICPACRNRGFLHSIIQLRGMVKDYTIPTSTPDVPVPCPSCIGIDIMKEQQDLRAELEAFSRVMDFGAIHAYITRMNVRRRELGYAFYQLDEREWGMLFDDMLSDGDGGEGAGDGYRYEEWDEANDPANGATLRPASEATIKSLPVKKYAEVKTDDPEACTVCREDFKGEQLVVQLPCHHFFCEDGCLVQWLKQYDSCPVCRARVPRVEEGGGIDSGHEDGTAAWVAGEGEQRREVTGLDHVAAIGGDYDVPMLDAW